VQADERIEDEQAWAERGDGRVEAVAIGGVIEPQRGRSDHLHVEIGERDAGGVADAIETTANEVQGILGGVEQHAPGARDGILAQAGGARCDGDGQVEGEKRLTALGLAADDAHGILGP